MFASQGHYQVTSFCHTHPRGRAEEANQVASPRPEALL